MPRRPPRKNPTAKPETIRGKRSFIWRTSSSRPACPPMRTKPSWRAIGKRTSRTADTQMPPARRTTHEAANIAAKPPRLTVATRTSRVRRAARAMKCRDRGAEHGNGDVGRRQPLCPVRVKEQRVGGDDEQGQRHPEGQRLRGQQPDDAAWRRGAHRAGSAVGRSRAAADERRDHAMGQLRPLGEQLVQHRLVESEDERRLQNRHRCAARLRHEGGKLADGDSRTELDQGLVAAMHTDAAVDDGVEAGFHRPLGDQHVSGRQAHLGRGFRHGGEHSARNPAKRSMRCSAATRSTRPSEAPAGIGEESTISARTIPQVRPFRTVPGGRTLGPCSIAGSAAKRIPSEPGSAWPAERLARRTRRALPPSGDDPLLRRRRLHRAGERLDPEPLDQVMTDFFEGVGPVVERHGGKLAKFIGDAVMAVFGLTELHEDDALRAVRAAVEMRHTLARLNDDFQRRYGVTLATRTGLNTGTVAGKGLVPGSQLRGRRRGERGRASPAARRAGRDPPGRVDVPARARLGRR